MATVAHGQNLVNFKLRSPLVGLIVLRVCDEGLELVVDAAGLAGVAGGGLQRHGGGAVRGQLEVEGVSRGAQLADQALLETRQRPLGSARRWVDLEYTYLM